jgi:flagellar L-ring protein FlgH
MIALPPRPATPSRTAVRRAAAPFLLASAVALALLAGCVPHISPYKPKIRKYKLDSYATAGNTHLDGSLWDESADTLFTHRRSTRVGDLVTVVIKEAANATRNAGTDLSRSSDMSVGVSAFAGLMKVLQSAYPSVDPSKLIDTLTKNDFKGSGETKSSGKLEATLTARIKQVLPNGDYYIEGSKVVMVNLEESHLYLSGVVRPSDIQADNSVSSDVIADAQVEYTGRGPVSDKQRPGWFQRLFDVVSPF